MLTRIVPRYSVVRMKSRWFQIHLSTAIILMLAAGIIVGVNVIPRSERIATLGNWSEEVVSLEQARVLFEQGMLNFGRDRLYGWPYQFYNYSDTVTIDGNRWKPVAGSGDFYWMHADNTASKRYLGYDILIWLAIPLALHAFINRIELHRPLRIHAVSIVLMWMALLMVYVWNVEDLYVQPPGYAKGWPWRAAFAENPLGPFEIRTGVLLANVMVAMGILMATVLVAEFVMRKRIAHAEMS